MHLWLVFVHIILVSTEIWASVPYRDDLEDNEFAEFEDFEDDDKMNVEDTSPSPRPQGSVGMTPPGQDGINDDDDDAIVEVGLITKIWIIPF